MQKSFLLLVVFSFLFCLKSVGQVASNTINITFDDNTYKNYVFIDNKSTFRCDSSGLSQQIGNDTLTSPNYSVFNGFYNNARTYLRYAAADLQSAFGNGAKVLYGIQFKIKNKQSYFPYTSFNVSIGSISSSIPNLVSGNNNFPVTATTVVYYGNYTTTIGWNTINFSTPYYWDGSSDLVLNICYGSALFSAIDEMELTAKPNNMALYGVNANLPTGCNIATGTASNLLPNIKFNYCTSPSYNGWQVCKTNKSGFGSGTTSKVIVTDSSKSYPKNDTTRFVLRFDSLQYFNSSLVSGVLAQINFSYTQRLITDSLKDFGLIEFSIDSGIHWDTLGNSVWFVQLYGFYSTAIFSGKHASWEAVNINFRICPITERLSNINSLYSITNSLWMRFSLLSDSVFDNLPGWEIDSISFQREWWTECPTGIQSYSTPFPLQIFPNPSSSNFNLTTNETIAAKGFDVSVVNVLGETIFSKNEIHQAHFTIDTQQFPAGIYFLKTHGSGYADANEKLVVEK